jgi:segregation and condensation protein B
MNLKQTIEALLFVSDRPLTKGDLAKMANAKKEEVEVALMELKNDCLNNSRGLVVLERDEKIQFSTAPETSTPVKEFLDFEVKEDLTPAALETLSVVAYRGPILKEEIDNIRGVNCSVILRHLMVKGLIDEKSEGERKTYSISFDLLRWVGCKNENDLPSYEKFHNLQINLPTDSSNPINNDSPNQNNPVGDVANQ